jgi:hypothetical protein
MKLATVLRDAERAYWAHLIPTMPEPITLRALAKIAGVAPATVMRRLARLGISYDHELVVRLPRDRRGR